MNPDNRLTLAQGRPRPDRTFSPIQELEIATPQSVKPRGFSRRVREVVLVVGGIGIGILVGMSIPKPTLELNSSFHSTSFSDIDLGAYTGENTGGDIEIETGNII